MKELIGDLYVPDPEISEVMLKVKEGRQLAPMWQASVNVVKAGLERNERIPAYRSHKENGGKLVLECDETDYATYMAELKGYIPSQKSLPVGIIGVPYVTDNAIVMGVVGGKHRLKGKLQGVPAGVVNLDELNPKKMSPIDSFYNELEEETGMKRGDISDVRFLGMVFDHGSRELAIVYGFNGGRTFSQLAEGLTRSGDGEYEYAVAIRNMRRELYNFVSYKDNATTHLRGAVALHALSHFPVSTLVGFLTGYDGSWFNVINKKEAIV